MTAPMGSPLPLLLPTCFATQVSSCPTFIHGKNKTILEDCSLKKLHEGSSSCPRILSPGFHKITFLHQRRLQEFFLGRQLWTPPHPKTSLGCFLTTGFREPLIFSRKKSFVRYVVLKYSFSIYSLSFHFPNRVFYRARVLNFDLVQFIDFFLYGPCMSLGSCLRTPHLAFLLFSWKHFIVLCFAFKSIIHFHFELIIV